MIESVYYRIIFNLYVKYNLITKKVSIVIIPKCWIKTEEELKQLENESLPF